MKINIFNYLNYKDYLKAVLKDTKPARGALAKMARGAPCQPSYLSQVLNGKPHLSFDQAYNIGEHIGLTSLESEFFLELLQFSKVASPRLRDRVRSKIEHLKSESQQVSKRLSRVEGLAAEEQAFYYSSWIPTAIHVCTDIPLLQTIDSLSHYLQLPRTVVEKTLLKLAEMGLVTREENGKWKHSGKQSHVERHSPYFLLHHQNWQQQALSAILEPSQSGLHFSGIYAISESDFERLKEFLLSQLADLNKNASASTSERLVCFNCDWFWAR